MILFGTMTVGGKTFTEKDSIGKISRAAVGLTDEFYGGFVKNFYRTKEGFLMCLDRKDNIINLGYTEESLTDEGKILLGLMEAKNKTLEDMSVKELKALASEKGIEFLKNANKESMLKLLSDIDLSGGEANEKDQDQNQDKEQGQTDGEHGNSEDES